MVNNFSMSSNSNSSPKINFDLIKLVLIGFILSLLVFILALVLVTIEQEKAEDKRMEEKLDYISSSVTAINNTLNEWELSE